jgi:hypothetical protein
LGAKSVVDRKWIIDILFNSASVDTGKMIEVFGKEGNFAHCFLPPQQSGSHPLHGRTEDTSQLSHQHKQ